MRWDRSGPLGGDSEESQKANRSVAQTIRIKFPNQIFYLFVTIKIVNESPPDLIFVGHTCCVSAFLYLQSGYIDHLEPPENVIILSRSRHLSVLITHIKTTMQTSSDLKIEFIFPLSWRHYTARAN